MYKNKLAVGITVLLIIGTFAFLALSNLQQAESEDKATVYTSIYPLYEVANRVAGDKIEIKLVVPNGAEIHSYEPTPRQIAELEKAALFFYIGLGLEPWVDKTVQNLKASQVKVIKATGNFELLTLNAEDHDHQAITNEKTGYDPHVWLDPFKFKKIGEIMLDEFSRIAPGDKEYFQERFQQLSSQLDKLDQEYRKALQDKQQDRILVSHSAFGYLGERYGFKQLSITGISPHQEPSPGTLVHLMEEAEKHNLKYVFLETLASPKTVNVLARERNLEILTLNPIAGLTEEEQTKGDDYFTLMRENLENLKKALVE